MTKKTAGKTKTTSRKATKSTRKRGPGRPTKFTPDRVKLILEAAERGCTLEGCARAGGIQYDTLNEWLKKSEAGDPGFQGFSETFARARAVGEGRLVEDAAKKDPVFLLKSSFGYVPREGREITGRDGEPLPEFRVVVPKENGKMRKREGADT